MLALSVASSVLGSYSKSQAIKDQQEAIDQQYEYNLAATRAALDTLTQRAGQLGEQIFRDKIRAQLMAEKAGVQAKGKRAVQTAVLGTTGKRTELWKEAEISREVGNAVTDAEINARIQEWNLQSQVTDQARAAMNALNNSVPSIPGTPSGLDNTINLGQSILGAYQSMDKYDKAEFRQTFSSE